MMSEPEMVYVTRSLLDYALEQKGVVTFDLNNAKKTAAERKGALLAYLIENHVGKEKAIKAFDIQYLFGDSTDRPTRLAIQELRNEGHLILSNAHGENKGYYMAASLEEYQEFRQYNFRSRAMSILVTDKAMATAARQQFGDAVQLDLFEE
jgi:hypothetical protein